MCISLNMTLLPQGVTLTASSTTTVSTAASPTSPAIVTSASSMFIPTIPSPSLQISIGASSSTQPTSGVSSDSTKPKSNKLVMIVVPVVLAILLLLMIAGGIVFWRRQKRLEQEIRGLKVERQPRTDIPRRDEGGGDYIPRKDEGGRD